ncbi:MAG: hypothetical protein ACK5OX_05910 [Desertimonas sp.]
MSATRAFGDQLDALGVWWPRGDGDALRQHAIAWRELADFLEDVSTVLDGSARLVVENHRGDAARRFGEHWTRWQGVDGYLGRTVADCRRLAAAADDFGGDIDTADRTLVHLVTEALARLDEPTTAWLRECADILGEDLAGRAAARCRGLDAVADLEVVEPDATTAPVDRAAIDPTAISWSDLGDPGDYRSLATTAVDFGAGEGALPADLLGQPAPGDPLVTAPEPDDPPGVEPDGVPEPDPDNTGDALGGGGGGGALGGGGLGGGGSLGSFGGAGGLVDVPLASADGLGLEPIPVEVEPPLGAAALAGTAAGLGVAAAKGLGSSGGRMPFFPFMPMMGGNSDNESDEPRRRKRR